MKRSSMFLRQWRTEFAWFVPLSAGRKLRPTISEVRRWSSDARALREIPRSGIESEAPVSGRVVSKKYTAERGFTLLEVIISVGILALIGAVSLVSFTNSRNVRDLTTSGQNVLSVLRLAQSKALGGEDNTQWGVRLEPAQFILFRGATYSGSTLTQVHTLPSSIEIVNINFSGGGQEVVFKRLTGQTDQIGTFVVRVKGSSAQNFSVTVDGSGKVYQSGSAPSETGARVIDTRHRSFNLGWSIQNSSTLTLTFYDPPGSDTVQNIAMSPAAPRTTFDWTGSYTIGGQSQTLRIHATSITAGNTILHIDRDCRKNTKKIKASIDTKDIATYEANCQTATAGAYGGTMSEP